MGWTIQVSDQHNTSMSGDKMIDNDYNTHWHSLASASYPKWAVIDMKKSTIVGRIIIYRRVSAPNTKVVRFYIADSPDVYSSDWNKIAEGEFADNISGEAPLVFEIPEFTGRYLKLDFPDASASFSGNNLTVREIEVYEWY
jgi:hypothetical protein